MNRVPQPPPPTETAALQESLDSCRLLSATPQLLLFRGRSRSRSPLLFAPALALLAAVPWMSSGALTWLQELTSAGLLAVCAGLLAMGLPRRTMLEVDPHNATLQYRGQLHQLPVPLRWQLLLAAPKLAPQCRYVAGLQAADGTFWELLSGPRPDLILQDLNRCREVWPLSVRNEWGPEHEAEPWNFGQLTVAVPRPTKSESKPLRAPRTDVHLPRVLSFMAVAVALFLGILYLQGTASGHTFNIVSALLPLLLVGQLAFAAFASSAQSQLRCDSHAIYLRGGIFGKTSRSVPRDSVRGAYLIGQTPTAEVCHLLLDTDYGPLASRVRSEAADKFLQQAVQQLGLNRRPTEASTSTTP